MAQALDKNGLPENWLPFGWTEISKGSMATNSDKIMGGIVDQTIKTGEWFVIPNLVNREICEFFATRNDAFMAFADALKKWGY